MNLNIKNNFKKIKFVKALNLNTSQSRNLEIKYAQNNYLFFLDSDCIPPCEILDSNYGNIKKENRRYH